jgi:hypothetical protein
MVREGLTFGRSNQDDQRRGGDRTFMRSMEDDEARLLEMGVDREQQRELMLARVAHDPERQRRMMQAFRDDDELIESIRAAGML